VRTELQEGVLERLIGARLLSDRSEEGGYRASAKRVQQEILSEPASQVDGKYSEASELARPAQIGITPERFASTSAAVCRTRS